jgi:F0F1-type ATP synthase membrane subunit b/b'
LLDKIEKAKEIVEAGKNISALKEENEMLWADLKKASKEHRKEMDVIEDAFNAEIESLKKTITEQADLLRTQQHKAEEVQKSHKRSTMSMREELDLLAGELDLIDVELRSKLLIFCTSLLTCVKCFL